ncbi:hypothetical protein EIP91_010078 [Steccherinum ochraceum]|uniref:Uncharacterized protein n=1 Tax=Steccherinum ochraceum TaxID=92696 RepID=A0A4R0R354_9APHY|nr:hypothetical protein EIP91_010078 [Steccherinum ochraceum]
MAGHFGHHEQTDESIDHAEPTPQRTATPVRISILSLPQRSTRRLGTHVRLQVGTPISEVPPSLHLRPKPQYYISTTFHAELILIDTKPDILLISSDHVLFYAHSVFLLSSSDNELNGLLGGDAARTGSGVTARSICVGVPVDSTLFNVVLHTIYGMSCRQFKPSLETLLQAVKTLKTYGIAIDQVVEHNTPFYDHIVAESSQRPVEVFLVAAENSLETLAVTTSAHLRSFLLSQITDEMVERMGPRYFNRLLKLHGDRMNYLKRLLLDAPKPHEEAVGCGVVEQRVLAQAWALARAFLVWKIKPDLPASVLQSTFGSLEEGLPCDACKKALDVRVRQIVLDWSTKAKRTI